MFFALPDEYDSAGLFGVAHACLLILSVLAIAVALYATRRCEESTVRRIIRIAAVVLWVLELAKIAFVRCVVRTDNPNEYVPLYFCSITLYALLLSSLRAPLLRRVGDCFLATGGVVGGAVFLLCPITSLTRYPAWHFISLHSFLLHALMVYLGVCILLTNVYRPRLRDILYYAGTVSVVCLVAFLYNTIYDKLHPSAPIANLMFLSKDFPGIPISLAYRLLGPFYGPVAWLAQATLPFLVVFGICYRVGKERV